MIGYIALVGFAATVPAANWLIHNAGAVCVPDGPCLIPVAPGLMAPSGVLMIGAALVLRDVVHERLGWRWAAAAVLAGAVLSASFAPAALVVASVAAFVLSELADMAVYAPLRRRRLLLAVAASGTVGAVIDSAVFLLIAFSSVDHLAGNTVGKLWMTMAAVAALAAMRRTTGRTAA